MNFLRRFFLPSLLGCLLLVPGAVSGQLAEEVPFITTPDNVTLEMLRLARVGANDHLIDLGSGDGRIVIVAARRFGATGLGVEIVPDLVEQSLRTAREAGVADKVAFRVQDLFQTDLSPATVVTMYLLPEFNLKLRGTRVVAHAFDMGEWQPDETASAGYARAYLWIVPAQVAGNWSVTLEGGKRATLALEQSFQSVGGSLNLDGRSLPLVGARLKGDELSFQFRGEGNAVSSFRGRVSGSRLSGMLSTDGVGRAFEASRS